MDCVWYHDCLARLYIAHCILLTVLDTFTIQTAREEAKTAFPWHDPKRVNQTLLNYREQANPDLSTPENIRKRQELKKSPLIANQINRIWLLLKKNAQGRLEKTSYMNLFIRLCKIFNPDFTFQEALRVVNDDFVRDSRGEKTLTYEMFYDSLFELVDIWHPDISEKGYADLLERIFRRITVKVRRIGGMLMQVPPIMRVQPPSMFVPPEASSAVIDTLERSVEAERAAEHALLAKLEKDVTFDEEIQKAMADAEAQVIQEEEARKAAALDRFQNGDLNDDDAVDGIIYGEDGQIIIDEDEEVRAQRLAAARERAKVAVEYSRLQPFIKQVEDRRRAKGLYVPPPNALVHLDEAESQELYGTGSEEVGSDPNGSLEEQKEETPLYDEDGEEIQPQTDQPPVDMTEEDIYALRVQILNEARALMEEAQENARRLEKADLEALQKRQAERQQMIERVRAISRSQRRSGESSVSGVLDLKGKEFSDDEEEDEGYYVLAPLSNVVSMYAASAETTAQIAAASLSSSSDQQDSELVAQLKTTTAPKAASSAEGVATDVTAHDPEEDAEALTLFTAAERELDALNGIPTPYEVVQAAKQLAEVPPLEIAVDTSVQLPSPRLTTVPSTAKLPVQPDLNASHELKPIPEAIKNAYLGPQEAIVAEPTSRATMGALTKQITSESRLQKTGKDGLKPSFPSIFSLAAVSLKNKRKAKPWGIFSGSPELPAPPPQKFPSRAKPQPLALPADAPKPKPTPTAMNAARMVASKLSGETKLRRGLMRAADSLPETDDPAPRPPDDVDTVPEPSPKHEPKPAPIELPENEPSEGTGLQASAQEEELVARSLSAIELATQFVNTNAQEEPEVAESFIREFALSTSAGSDADASIATRRQIESYTKLSLSTEIDLGDNAAGTGFIAYSATDAIHLGSEKRLNVFARVEKVRLEQRQREAESRAQVLQKQAMDHLNAGDLEHATAMHKQAEELLAIAHALCYNSSHFTPNHVLLGASDQAVKDELSHLLQPPEQPAADNEKDTSDTNAANVPESTSPSQSDVALSTYRIGDLLYADSQAPYTELYSGSGSVDISSSVSSGTKLYTTKQGLLEVFTPSNAIIPVPGLPGTQVNVSKSDSDLPDQLASQLRDVALTSRAPPSVWIVGKPLTGKSSLAKTLQLQYGLVRITPDDAVAYLLANPPSKISPFLTVDGKSSALASAGEWMPCGATVLNPGNEAVAVATANLESAVRAIQDGAVLTPAHMYALLRYRMASPQVRHHGYVLEGAFGDIDLMNFLSACSELKGLWPPQVICGLHATDQDVLLRVSEERRRVARGLAHSTVVVSELDITTATRERLELERRSHLAELNAKRVAERRIQQINKKIERINDLREKILSMRHKSGRSLDGDDDEVDQDIDYAQELEALESLDTDNDDGVEEFGMEALDDPFSLEALPTDVQTQIEKEIAKFSVPLTNAQLNEAVRDAIESGNAQLEYDNYLADHQVLPTYMVQGLRPVFNPFNLDRKYRSASAGNLVPPKAEDEMSSLEDQFGPSITKYVDLIHPLRESYVFELLEGCGASRSASSVVTPREIYLVELASRGIAPPPVSGSDPSSTHDNNGGFAQEFVTPEAEREIREALQDPLINLPFEGGVLLTPAALSNPTSLVPNTAQTGVSTSIVPTGSPLTFSSESLVHSTFARTTSLESLASIRLRLQHYSESIEPTLKTIVAGFGSYDGGSKLYSRPQGARQVLILSANDAPWSIVRLLAYTMLPRIAAFIHKPLPSDLSLLLADPSTQTDSDAQRGRSATGYHGRSEHRNSDADAADLKGIDLDDRYPINPAEPPAVDLLRDPIAEVALVSAANASTATITSELERTQQSIELIRLVTLPASDRAKRAELRLTRLALRAARRRLQRQILNDDGGLDIEVDDDDDDDPEEVVFATLGVNEDDDVVKGNEDDNSEEFAAAVASAVASDPDYALRCRALAFAEDVASNPALANQTGTLLTELEPANPLGEQADSLGDPIELLAAASAGVSEFSVPYPPHALASALKEPDYETSSVFTSEGKPKKSADSASDAEISGYVRTEDGVYIPAAKEPVVMPLTVHEVPGDLPGPGVVVRPGVFQTFCPVALLKDGRLLLGDPNTSALYKGTVYYFLNAEYRSLFLENPTVYLSTPPTLPQQYVVVLVGCPYSGKSALARKLAVDMGFLEITPAQLREWDAAATARLEHQLAMEIQQQQDDRMAARQDERNRLLESGVSQEELDAEEEENRMIAESRGEIDDVMDIQAIQELAREQAYVGPIVDRDKLTGIYKLDRRRVPDWANGIVRQRVVIDGSGLTTTQEMRDLELILGKAGMSIDCVVNLCVADVDNLPVRRRAVLNSIRKLQGVTNGGQESSAEQSVDSEDIELEPEEDDSEDHALIDQALTFQEVHWKNIEQAINEFSFPPRAIATIDVSTSRSLEDSYEALKQVVDPFYEYRASRMPKLLPDLRNAITNAASQPRPVSVKGLSMDKALTMVQDLVKQLAFKDVCFSPVALIDKGLLVPGKAAYTVTYGGALYRLWSHEEVEAFFRNPRRYHTMDPCNGLFGKHVEALASSKSRTITGESLSLIPQPRVMLIGPCGSGKSALAVKLARRLGVVRSIRLSHEFLPRLTQLCNNALVEATEAEAKQKEVLRKRRAAIRAARDARAQARRDRARAREAARRQRAEARMETARRRAAIARQEARDIRRERGEEVDDEAEERMYEEMRAQRIAQGLPIPEEEDFIEEEERLADEQAEAAESDAEAEAEALAEADEAAAITEAGGDTEDGAEISSRIAEEQGKERSIILNYFRAVYEWARTQARAVPPLSVKYADITENAADSDASASLKPFALDSSVISKMDDSEFSFASKVDERLERIERKRAIDAARLAAFIERAWLRDLEAQWDDASKSLDEARETLVRGKELVQLFEEDQREWYQRQGMHVDESHNFIPEQTIAELRVAAASVEEFGRQAQVLFQAIAFAKIAMGLQDEATAEAEVQRYVDRVDEENKACLYAPGLLTPAAAPANATNPAGNISNPEEMDPSEAAYAAAEAAAQREAELALKKEAERARKISAMRLTLHGSLAVMAQTSGGEPRTASRRASNAPESASSQDSDESVVAQAASVLQLVSNLADDSRNASRPTAAEAFAALPAALTMLLDSRWFTPEQVIDVLASSIREGGDVLLSREEAIIRKQNMRLKSVQMGANNAITDMSSSSSDASANLLSPFSTYSGASGAGSADRYDAAKDDLSKVLGPQSGFVFEVDLVCTALSHYILACLQKHADVIPQIVLPLEIDEAHSVLCQKRDYLRRLIVRYSYEITQLGQQAETILQAEAARRAQAREANVQLAQRLLAETRLALDSVQAALHEARHQKDGGSSAGESESALVAKASDLKARAAKLEKKLAKLVFDGSRDILLGDDNEEQDDEESSSVPRSRKSSIASMGGDDRDDHDFGEEDASDSEDHTAEESLEESSGNSASDATQKELDKLFIPSNKDINGQVWLSKSEISALQSAARVLKDPGVLSHRAYVAAMTDVEAAEPLFASLYTQTATDSSNLLGALASIGLVLASPVSTVPTPKLLLSLHQKEQGGVSIQRKSKNIQKRKLAEVQSLSQLVVPSWFVRGAVDDAARKAMRALQPFVVRARALFIKPHILSINDAFALLREGVKTLRPFGFNCPVLLEMQHRSNQALAKTLENRQPESVSLSISSQFGSKASATDSGSIVAKLLQKTLASSSSLLSVSGAGQGNQTPYDPNQVEAAFINSTSDVLLSCSAYPVLWGHHIIFCSSRRARLAFMADVTRFIHVAPPLPKVTPSCMVLGPQLAFKSTLAKSLAASTGMQVLTPGSVLSSVAEGVIDPLNKPIEYLVRSAVLLPPYIAKRTSGVDRRRFVTDSDDESLEFSFRPEEDPASWSLLGGGTSCDLGLANDLDMKDAAIALVRKHYGEIDRNRWHLSGAAASRVYTAPPTALGRVVKSLMSDGLAVSDSLLVLCLCEVLKRASSRLSGWILDGFSNTKKQAAYMQQLGAIPMLIIALHLGESKLLVHRVIARRAQELASAAHEAAALGVRLRLPPLRANNSMGGEMFEGAEDVMILDEEEEAEMELVRQVFERDQQMDEEGLSLEEAVQQLPPLPDEPPLFAPGGVLAVNQDDESSLLYEFDAESTGSVARKQAVINSWGTNLSSNHCKSLAAALARYGSVSSGVSGGALTGSASTQALLSASPSMAALLERLDKKTTVALHRSLERYREEILPVLTSWQSIYDNVCHVDADRAVWATSSECTLLLGMRVLCRALFVRAVQRGQPAYCGFQTIAHTVQRQRQSHFRDYCPVNWVDKSRLVKSALAAGNLSELSYSNSYNSHQQRQKQQSGYLTSQVESSLAQAKSSALMISHQSLSYVVMVNGRFYHMGSAADLEKFLQNPERYTSVSATPLPENLPRRLTLAECHAISAEHCQLGGVCPVTLHSGLMRGDVKVVYGKANCAVLYRGKIYRLAGEKQLVDFTARPHIYEKVVLPQKLPPQPAIDPSADPAALLKLNMCVAYLEQVVAQSLTQALGTFATVRLQYPCLTTTQTALIYLALLLRARNPRASPALVQEYENRLAKFVCACSLVPTLAAEYRDARDVKLPKAYLNQATFADQLARLAGLDREALAKLTDKGMTTTRHDSSASKDRPAFVDAPHHPLAKGLDLVGDVGSELLLRDREWGVLSSPDIVDVLSLGSSSSGDPMDCLPLLMHLKDSKSREQLMSRLYDQISSEIQQHAAYASGAKYEPATVVQEGNATEAPLEVLNFAPSALYFHLSQYF